jgi:TolB-like protein/Flp pilus assembly protein TadD
MGPNGESRLRFGAFEADLHSRELFKNGKKLPIQDKPFRILALLLQNPGQFVTREELFSAVWGKVFVQKDLSLNTAIRRLRLALRDGHAEPKLVETVGSRGYRLTAPVSVLDGAALETKYAERRMRLAVAPFANLSDQHADYLSDGLTEQMITQLGRLCKEVSIIAPISSMRFKGSAKSLLQIADELRADYVLSGSVMRVPRRLRITAKLIRASDQSCVWSESYTREDADIFFVQDEITRSIARAILHALPAQAAQDSHLRTIPATYEKYLKACFFATKWIDPAFRKAIDLFAEVVHEDPNFAPGHASLALIYTGMGQYGGISPQDVYTRVRSAATSALRLCEELAEAHVALGYAQFFYDGDWAAAETTFLRALEINPSCSAAYTGLAQLLSILGRHAEAMAAAKRGRELDPFSPLVHTILVLCLYFAGRLREALEFAHACIELEPAFATIHAMLGSVYQALGDSEQATSSYRNAVRLCPESPLMQAHLAYGLAANGSAGESRRILEELLKLRKLTYVSPHWIGVVFAALGHQSQALLWFDTAVRERCGWRVVCAVDPRLRCVARNPQFKRLLLQIGFQKRLDA